MKKTFKYYYAIVTESRESIENFVKFMGSKVRNSRYSDWSNSDYDSSDYSNSDYDSLEVDQQEDISDIQKNNLKEYIQPELEKLGCSENFITSFFEKIFEKDYPDLLFYIEKDLIEDIQKEIQKKPK